LYQAPKHDSICLREQIENEIGIAGIIVTGRFLKAACRDCDCLQVVFVCPTFDFSRQIPENVVNSLSK
jgi:hypothetical protein